MTAPNALQTEALQAIQDNGGKHNLARFRRATKDKLVRAGWATRVDGLFQLTENGRQVIAAPTATPREVDEALAAAWHVADKADAAITSAASTMRHIYAGHIGQRVTYGRKGAQFPREATADAAAAWFETLDQDASLMTISNYSGTIGGTLSRYTERITAHYAAMVAVRKLDMLYTGWSRFFLVTSSAGHVHSSTGCHTCRDTTTYGWMPELSGKSEAEAVAELGAVLCSACFPTAPVAHQGGKITKAQASKLAA